MKVWYSSSVVMHGNGDQVRAAVGTTAADGREIERQHHGVLVIILIIIGIVTRKETRRKRLLMHFFSRSWVLICS